MPATQTTMGRDDRETDEKSGRYTVEFPLEDFIDALEALGGSAGTQDVADEVGCKYRTANSKLHDLEDEGEITSRKVGNAYLWILEDGNGEK